MGTAQLEYVENRQDILVSFLNFNEDCEQYPELTRSLLRTTSFWVYNPDTKAFAPSKFTGFKNMNFPNYIAARKGLYLGNNFNGHLTRKAIGSILGIYRPDDKLSAQLKRRMVLASNRKVSKSNPREKAWISVIASRISLIRSFQSLGDIDTFCQNFSPKARLEAVRRTQVDRTAKQSLKVILKGK